MQPLLLMFCTVACETLPSLLHERATAVAARSSAAMAVLRLRCFII